MNYLDEIMRQLDDLRRQVAALQRIEALTDATYVKLAGRSGGQRVSGIASTGYALEVYRDLAAASTNSAVFAVTQDNASDDQDALRVQQDGTGDVVELLDGATVVLRVLDGGRLDVYNIIRALTASGLRLEDDGGNLAIFVEDGGNVGINTNNPSERLHISEGAFRISRDSTSGPGYFEFEETQGGGKIGKFDINGGVMRFGERFVSNIFGVNLANQRVGITEMAPSGKLHIDQASTTAAIPVLILDQADLSEEFIEFTATVGAGNPIDTAAVGTYYGKVRVNVTGVGYKYLALYNT